MRNITAVAIAAFVLAAVSMVGCGSRAGGGGGGFFQTVGGPPGAACNPQAHNEGCNINAGVHNRVSCDATTSTWKLVAACPAGHTCTTAADPAAPGTGKMIGVCVSNASAGQVDAGFDDPWAGVDTYVADSGGVSGPVVQDVSASAQDASGGTVVVPDTGGGSGSIDVDEPEPHKDVGGGEPTVYKGCLDPKDAKYLKSLADKQAEADKFGAMMESCSMSCLTKFGEKAQVACLTDCIKGKTNLTDSCIHCQAKYRAYCGINSCMSPCFAGKMSQACLDCVEKNCDPGYEKCAAGNDPAAP